jgi:hypothetical protein
MNARALLVLCAIAAVLTVLAIVAERSGSDGGAGGGEIGAMLLPDLAAEINAVDRVTVSGAGGETIATLVRTADGWTIAEQDGYAADVVRIRDVLLALAEARIVEEKTSNPDFYDRLGVGPVEAADARSRRISITAGSRSFPSVILGDPSGAEQRFARREDEAPSYLIDRNPDLPEGAAQWAVAEIIDIESARVQRVEITHADGERLVISKAGREQTSYDVEDVPEGRELQYATIANVTGGALRDLGLEAVARQAPEPPEPVTISEFWTFDGLVVTVSGRRYGEDIWVSFDARFDAEQALRFATEPVEGSVAEETPTTDDSAQDDAAAIGAQLSGWRYRIPSYQYEQMARRMEDLLRSAE